MRGMKGATFYTQNCLSNTALYGTKRENRELTRTHLCCAYPAQGPAHATYFAVAWQWTSVSSPATGFLTHSRQTAEGIYVPPCDHSNACIIVQLLGLWSRVEAIQDRRLWTLCA